MADPAGGKGQLADMGEYLAANLKKSGYSD
jgi:hypothetical protein